MVALAVAIAMLTVVSATPWVLVLAIAAAFIPFSRLGLTLNLPTMLPWLITLGLLMALAFAPILGAPGFLAVNAAIMGAALLGILTVSPGLPALGRAFPSFLVIIVGIPLKLAILYGIHAA
jgi:hypothetical protein